MNMTVIKRMNVQGNLSNPDETNNTFQSTPTTGTDCDANIDDKQFGMDTEARRATGQTEMSGKGAAKPQTKGQASPGNQKTHSRKHCTAVQQSQFCRLFGFEWRELCSVRSLVELLHRPTDPSSLGVMRILFGLLMLLDVFHERGMHMVEFDYGDPTQCRFPLFDFLQPLPLQWMYVVFLALIIGALGILLGLFYRLSCLLFLLAYWYLFLLDKSVWNNHSYLYGLCSILLLLTDANRYWSVDGLLWRRKRSAHVPLWNYAIFRAQFFLVYFIAGLKKMEPDWLQGYSMNSLSAHWVFAPLTALFSHETIDLWVVHRCGFCLDLFIGFVLFFDATRPLGFLFGGSFHLMNSRMFTIGMFPYAMLATMPIFCHADWPRKLGATVRAVTMGADTTADPQLQRSDHCIYRGQWTKQLQKGNKKKEPAAVSQTVGFYHKCCSLFFIIYLSAQGFLPYSHFITKGYNSWTNGLYGYSWDMMVHSWSTQHITITYVNRDTGQTGFLKSDAWTQGGVARWASHVDMTKQYAMCLQQRLRSFNITNVTLYFDVWRSLNDRFQQRLYDPRVDLVTADWHPFRETPWVMPLLTQLSDWRGRLDEIERQIYNSSNFTDVVFIADIPGLELINYVEEDLGNTSVQVLNGTVQVYLPHNDTTVTLHPEDKMQLPAGEYHHIRTVSAHPSCYMYIFKNTTEIALSEQIRDVEHQIKQGVVNESEIAAHLREARERIHKSKAEMRERAEQTLWTETKQLVVRKSRDVYRSLWMLSVALRSIATATDFETVFNQTVLQASKRRST